MRIKKLSISSEKISVQTIDQLTWTVLQSTLWQACCKELPCSIHHIVSSLSSNAAILSFRTKQWWRPCLVETAPWMCQPRTRTAWWCWEPPGWGKAPLSHGFSMDASRTSILPPLRIFTAKSTTSGETCISWTFWTPLGITLSRLWGGFPSWQVRKRGKFADGEQWVKDYNDRQ